MVFGTERRGLMLRLGGVAALVLAAATARVLFGDQASEIGAADLVLALILFAAASAGSALLLLGGHLFDRVEVSARWGRPRDTGPARRTEPTRGGDGMKVLRELAAMPSLSQPQAARVWTARSERESSPSDYARL